MYITLDNARVYFDIDGAGSRWRDGGLSVTRPPLLMLPGGPAASHMHYKNPMGGFGRFTEWFQAIYIDWPGAAESDPLPLELLTLDRAVAAVEVLRETLGIEQWAVLGASAGGTWSLAYASAFPERVTQLVSMHCPLSFDNFAEVAERNARRAGIDDPVAIDLYRRFGTGQLTGPVEEWAPIVRDTIIRTQQATYIDRDKHPEHVKEHQRRWDSVDQADLFREMEVAHWYLSDLRRHAPTAERLGCITAPTLVITGEEDPVAPATDARLIHDAVAGSELYLHAGRHMPHGAEQQPFFQRIDEFFQKHGVDYG